jgi:Flp pilus assembly protein TadG
VAAENNHSVRRARSRAHGDDGAALVEFALVMPVLFLLLFGIVEFGINMNDYQSLRQGVRDAARQAVVADYGSGSCVPVAATAAGNTAAVQCTARVAASLPALAVKVVVTDNNGSTDFSTDKVKVCAVTTAKSITGILAPFLKSVYMKSSVEMRAEKNLTLANAQDADPSGANWSWC